ncbi:carbohydrate kinase [Aliiroseovarius sp. KMU-50]|uniref:Carbohydrate kinase n=1 Tax=Aliiroseovarius salicola TaxID=3009082 RepID=A0ABT4W288_9RHOB|nr:carbohydrate kinase [Aliiroseovarius sp. KMU-50]MDA5094631.1 carbohydrate kinase [Aliiroseovarius sp. KMU-50]
MPLEILCCGEALIDMIPSAVEGGGEGFVPHTGGAVFNTAIALGRLGVRAGLLTGLSSDMFGQQLAADLAASQVDVTHIVHTDRPTTLAFVHLSDGHASYSFFDENSAGRMLLPSDMPVLDQKISALFFGGISLACEPGADAYAALAEREGTSRVVMLDPNIRPGFIEDEERFRERLTRLLTVADIVKVSDEDLDWFIPEDMAQAKKLEKVQSMGPSVVLMTKGGDGAMARLRDGQEVHVSAVPATVVDTVGAGDTFNAGVLAMLSSLGCLSKTGIRKVSPENMEKALSYGARVAAITVSRAGANPPWVSELDI